MGKKYCIMVHCNYCDNEYPKRFMSKHIEECTEKLNVFKDETELEIIKKKNEELEIAVRDKDEIIEEYEKMFNEMILKKNQDGEIIKHQLERIKYLLSENNNLKLEGVYTNKFIDSVCSSYDDLEKDYDVLKKRFDELETELDNSIPYKEYEKVYDACEIHIKRNQSRNGLIRSIIDLLNDYEEDELEINRTKKRKRRVHFE